MLNDKELINDNKWLGCELSGDILQLDGEGEHEGGQEGQGGQVGGVSQVLSRHLVFLVAPIVITQAILQWL